ncbi:hypothetical protein [Lederbergia citri]|uniref:Lipoprotein n=1 Tax=Lederbergia citri TaxID=2833580 RepID=A0A942YG12_9BACI|nr:hypothetical protein [Lederbergia citri]MBS4195062.1 hypothetical protein [Lederbergia citri]
MNKLIAICLAILIFLSGCQSSDASMVNKPEILSALREQDLLLKEMKVPKDNIFGMKLNGIRPTTFELDDKLFLVYIYKSELEREKGFKDFQNKTAAVNLVSYNYYEAKNALIFYVHGRNLAIEVERDDKIQKAVDVLNGK